jgi:hypothetical protein
MDNNIKNALDRELKLQLAAKITSFVVLIVVCLDSLAILLKLLGLFPNVSWGWILAPLWGPVAFSLTMLVVGGISLLAVKVLLLISSWLVLLAKGLKR